MFSHTSEDLIQVVLTFEWLMSMYTNYCLMISYNSFLIGKSLLTIFDIAIYSDLVI